jgi:hypothetical protein
MVPIVAIVSAVIVVACAWPLSARVRRARQQSRLIRAEAARGITRLESMLADRAARPRPRPGRRGGDTARDGERR